MQSVHGEVSRSAPQVRSGEPQVDGQAANYHSAIQGELLLSSPVSTDFPPSVVNREKDHSLPLSMDVPYWRLSLQGYVSNSFLQKK